MVWNQRPIPHGMLQALHMVESNIRHSRLVRERDAYARAIDAVLRAYLELAQVAGERARVRALVGLRAALFPHHLGAVDAVPTGATGSGHGPIGQITREQRALLASTPMLGGTLADTVDAWLATMDELATLERGIVPLKRDCEEGLSMTDRRAICSAG